MGTKKCLGGSNLGFLSLDEQLVKLLFGFLLDNAEMKVPEVGKTAEGQQNFWVNAPFLAPSPPLPSFPCPPSAVTGNFFFV